MIDLSQQKIALLAKRAELKPPSRDELAVERLADPIDQALSDRRRELAGEEVNRVNGLIRMIDAALERIEAGEYGYCGSCGEPISEKRLLAAPWAAECVPCREITEAREREAAAMELQPRRGR